VTKRSHVKPGHVWLDAVRYATSVVSTPQGGVETTFVPAGAFALRTHTPCETLLPSGLPLNALLPFA
jgi:hypothetical protein